VRTTAVNRAGLLAIAVGLGGAAACSERTLLQIDITGDRRFENVVLRLTASPAEASAAPREADFANAQFDPTNAYKAGLYLPAGWSGTVTVAARVIEGACEVAAGSAIARDIHAAELSAVVPLLVVSHASCIPVGDGSAGGSGGGAGGTGTGGTGGSTGGGGGAAGGAAGAGGTGGASGVAGSAGGSGTGGASGRTGTGGAAGAGGGIAGTTGRGGNAAGGAGGTAGSTVVGTGGGSGGTAGRGGAGGAGGCSQSNADACGARNCGSVQNTCGQVIPCGTCRNDQCCELGVCGPAGNPPRC
jgi:hypothetical protein